MDVKTTAFESKSGSRLLLSADMMQEDWTSVADDIDYLMEGNEWQRLADYQWE